jgi:hypothetical protein
MASDIKAGNRADNQNGLRDNPGAAFDLSDMCEATTKTPSLVKRLPTEKSLVPVLSAIQ